MSSQQNDSEDIQDDECKIIPQDSKYQPSYTFKLIVIGDSGVGKTCLSLRAAKDIYTGTNPSTVGFELVGLYIKYDNQIILLQIWDTCGQEAYHSLISKFYKNTNACVIVYSIADKTSFQHCEMWLNEMKNNAPADTKSILVGNKMDLNDNRQVSKEEALKFKLDKEIDLIFESSAKHGDNSQEIFKEIAKMLYKNLKKSQKGKEFENQNKKKKNALKNKGYVKYGTNEKLPAFNDDDDDNFQLGNSNPYEDEGGSCKNKKC